MPADPDPATGGGVSRKLLLRVLPRDLMFSCDRRRVSIIAAVKYLFKDVKNTEEKTQLPPLVFHGKLFTASRKFFTRAIRKLWKEEVRAGPSGSAAAPADRAPGVDHTPHGAEVAG